MKKITCSELDRMLITGLQLICCRMTRIFSVVFSMQPYIGAMDSMRKSNSYQGLDQRSTYSSQLNQEIDPVANRWHTRSPVQKEEIRFMPPHNGMFALLFCVAMYKAGNFFPIETTINK